MIRRLSVLGLAAGVLVGLTSASQPPPGPSADPGPNPSALSIAGPRSVSPYGLCRLSLVGGTIEDAEWEVLYSADLTQDVDGLELDPAGTGYVFTGRPGSYRVSAWTVSKGKIGRASTVVIIEGQEPAPGPAPIPPVPPGPNPPGPAPVPPPVAAKLWAIAIYDVDRLASLPASQRDIRVSTTIKAALAGLNATWRTFDDNAFLMNTPSWKLVIGQAGIPSLIVTDEHGKLLHSEKLPIDEAGVLAVVKKLRGS